MGTYNPMITQMIQDAVLKLCTQNIMFQKSLEIDGIICVSSGEEQRDIVVKMHRTIVKPEVAPTPVESWSSSIESDWQNTVNTNTPRNTSFDSYDSSTPIGNRRSESRPGHRGPYKSKHTVVNEPPKRTFNEVHEPPEPTATLETPGGLDIDSDYSVTNIKAEPDTSPNSKRKNSDSNIDQNEEVPAKLPKYNIKEEAITIELNDEDDDDGGEVDTETAGASWMGAEGDDATRTYDNIDSMHNTYASADTGDESQMHDAGGAMQGAGGDIQGAGGDMGDQSEKHRSLPKDSITKATLSKALVKTKMGHKKHADLCSFCGKPFLSKSGLCDHIVLKHGGKAKFTCTVGGCGRAFQRHERYVAHKSSHANHKEYECDKCSRQYRTSESLHQHILMKHSEEKDKESLKCRLCDGMFLPNNMRRHIQAKHEHIKFECPFCHVVYGYKGSLDRHMKKCKKFDDMLDIPF